MLARLSAFVIWALIAGTVVFWGFRLAVRPEPAPRHTVVMGDASVGRVDLTRLFGAPPVVEVAAAAAAPVSSRFRLIGIMAPPARAKATASGGGLALIAVDGKPARAYAVGAKLDPDLVLQSVTLRTASLASAQGGQTVLLQIPPLAPPATGVPPSFSGGGMPASSVPGEFPPGSAPGGVPGATPGAFPPGLPMGGAPMNPPDVLGTGVRPMPPPGGMGQPPGVAPAMAIPMPNNPGPINQ
jgi:general secretion pathway protein C